MDKVTLTALKESIEKWEKRAAGDHTLELGIHACPLCVVHVIATGTCRGCPINEATGGTSCDETPYLDYVEDPTIANAEAELNFLKSLLPAEEKEEQKAFGWVGLNYLK